MDPNFDKIVKKYRALADNQFSSSYIVKDTSFLQLLAIYLTTPAEETTETASVLRSIIDILFILSATKSNMVQISSVYGVIQAVQFVVNKKTLPGDLNVKARHILKRLSKFKITKKLILYTSGLNKDVASVIESALVNTNGVVSVVIDVIHLRCSVRVLPEVEPTEVANNVYEHTGIEMKLVSKNSFGQEILIPLVDSKSSSFCDDEEWPSYCGGGSSPEFNKVVARKLGKENDDTSNWIDSAINVFQKSFYW